MSTIGYSAFIKKIYQNSLTSLQLTTLNWKEEIHAFTVEIFNEKYQIHLQLSYVHTGLPRVQRWTRQLPKVPEARRGRTLKL